MLSGNWNLDRIRNKKKKNFVPKFSREYYAGGKKGLKIPANIYLFTIETQGKVAKYVQS